VKLTQLQYKELAKYLLDLSKLFFVSLILKLFEPNAPRFTVNSLVIAVFGLTISLVFAILGIKLLRKVKTDVH
jgi:hypothetical protein